jgi:uncharacterized DUF497 family protein
MPPVVLLMLLVSVGCTCGARPDWPSTPHIRIRRPVRSAIVPAKVWIGDILISERIEEKIRRKHGVRPEEVEEACRFGNHERVVWHDHHNYGRRLIVVGRTRGGRRLVVILSPVDEPNGVWSLRTAMGYLEP